MSSPYDTDDELLTDGDDLLHGCARLVLTGTLLAVIAALIWKVTR